MQAIRNPVNFLSLLPLLPAESKFVSHLKDGISCEVGNKQLPQKPIQYGDAANVVRSEVIRFFAFRGDKRRFVRGAIIALQGAWIDGESLNLMHVHIPYALRFYNCYFASAVNMRNAKCEALCMNGSYLARELMGNGLKTKSDVLLNGDFVAKKGVQLRGANIGGNFFCTDGRFLKSKKFALDLTGITTKGGVYLNQNFFAKGGVRLLAANIGKDFSCTGGKFHKSEKYALDAAGLKTKGSVFLHEGFYAKGEVRLLGASIGENWTARAVILTTKIPRGESMR